MKIGFNEATSRDCSTLEQDLELCEALGFDYIEIRFDKLDEYLQEHSMDDLIDFFKKSHIKPHALNALYTYREMFSPRDDRQCFDEKMAEFRRACSLSDMMGSGYLIVVPPLGSSNYGTPYDGIWQETKESCVRALTRLSDMAAEYSLKLCFELVGAPKSSVRSIEQANEIISEVNRENVGLVLDVANIYMNGKLTDYSAMLKLDPAKIFAVHLNDFEDVPVAEFDVSRRCFCGLGAANVRGFLETLKRTGFEGMASIEVFRPEYWAMAPEEVITQAYNTTYDIMKECGCLDEQ